MTSKCVQCKNPLEKASTGRPRKFCSPRCRLVAHRSRQRETKGGLVPAALAKADRWVGWRSINRRGRWTKLPVTVEGVAASSTNPDTWGSLSAVQAEFGEKLGFVLGEGVGCVDLDNCIRPDGSLTNGAQFILDSLPARTWVEVSPSGNGLHVWGLLSEQRGRVTKVWDQSVEVYSQGRYMTVTGKRWEQSSLDLVDLEGLVSDLL